jgi:hypothetical protein
VTTYNPKYRLCVSRRLLVSLIHILCTLFRSCWFKRLNVFSLQGRQNFILKFLNRQYGRRRDHRTACQAQKKFESTEMHVNTSLLKGCCRAMLFFSLSLDRHQLDNGLSVLLLTVLRQWRRKSCRDHTHSFNTANSPRIKSAKTCLASVFEV